MEARVPISPVANCPVIHELALDEYIARAALAQAQDRGFAALDRRQYLLAEADALQADIQADTSHSRRHLYPLGVTILRAVATLNTRLSRLDGDLIDSLRVVIDNTPDRMQQHTELHHRYGTCMQTAAETRQGVRSRWLGHLAFWRRGRKPTHESTAGLDE